MTLLARTDEEILQRIARDLVRPIATVKREAIERAMILCEGNVSEAAKRLGVSRVNLTRLLAKYRKDDA